MQLAEKSISRVTQLRKPQKYALVFFHIPKCWPWGKSPPGIVHLEESAMKKKLTESTCLFFQFQRNMYLIKIENIRTSVMMISITKSRLLGSVIN